MTENSSKPPKMAENLLEVLLFRAVDFGAMWDYEEQYQRITGKKGILFANLWYFLQIILTFPGFMKNTISWSIIMIKNYIKIALRNLKRQKVYSLINILGLAVGMAGFTIFALAAGTKSNADRFHKNADRIYTVVQVKSTANTEKHTSMVPVPLVKPLKNEFPEIEDVVRVLPAGRTIIKYQNNRYYENKAIYADPNFLTFFTFSMISGNPNTALREPFSIVLTKTAADKIFKNENPVGKVLTIDKKVNVTVTGVLEDMRRTSSMEFEILISIETARALDKISDEWGADKLMSFLLLKDGTDKNQIEKKLPAFVSTHFTDSDKSPDKMYIFPYLDTRLKSRHIIMPSFMHQAFMWAIYLTFGIGTLLLLVVCINFINLSTARNITRTNEIGMRKIMGAGRMQLIRQFLGESILLSLLAVPVAILLYELVHPMLYSFIPNVSKVSNSVLNYPFLIKYMVIAAVLTGIFSGLYPAIFLSSFKPEQVLKSKRFSGKKKRRGSKFMIVVQFSVAIIFIVFPGTFREQFEYLFIKGNMGYNRDEIAVVRMTDEVKSNMESMKTEVSRHANVVSVTSSVSLPGIWDSPVKAWPEGVDEKNASTIEAYGIDYGFIEMLGLEVRQGRSFSKNFSDEDRFVINEATVRQFKWENPVGKQLVMGDKKGTVIGVVKDFIFKDIDGTLPPAVLFLDPENTSFMLVKYAKNSSYDELYKYLEKQWNTFAPELPFDCDTLENYLMDFLGILLSMASFFNIIGVITVFFSCLGLLGLSSYVAEQRTKEIGIRKVLGAPTKSIIWNLIREYMILVFIANIITLPLIYFIWREILMSFNFTHIGISAYVFAAFVSILAAVIAVTSQTIKAARANPVDSIRYE